MSKELQRYFAALIGCVIGAAWVAAGFGAAFAGLVASVLGYWVVALAQRRPLEVPIRFALPDLSGIAARRSIHDSRRPSSHRETSGPHRRGNARAVEPIALEAQLADESLDSAAAQYGW